MRLDRLLSRTVPTGGRELKKVLREGKVTVNGLIQTVGATQVGRFDEVAVGGRIVHGRRPRYLLLHKPAGAVSATTDRDHPTVIDLIPSGPTDDLHLAGRLDRATTGVVLLSNDGLWSGRITDPTAKLPKSYLVETEEPIVPQLVDDFARGIALPGDGVITLPSQLEILAPRGARIVLREGRHHQVKRMFAVYENKVVGLHRESVGEVGLDGLKEGACRELTCMEIVALADPDPSALAALERHPSSSN